jgi:hypothetical protein
MSGKFLLSCLAALPLCAAPSNTCRPSNSFEQGHELTKSQMPAAYNAPARINVRGSWDLYLTASYLFWQPSEENLELCLINSTKTTLLGTGLVPVVIPQGKIQEMGFKYKSGFKAGLGIATGWDHWDAYAQYTWLTGRHSSHATAPTDQNGATTGSLVPLWGNAFNTPSEITSGKSRWRLNLQFIDANLGRSCYVGTKLTFRPFFGARAAWIDQKYVATYLPADMTSYQDRQTTRSWGIGAEAGMLANWLVGAGFRFIGSMETDILYTRYKLRIKEESYINPLLLFTSLKETVFYLRPHLDLQLGLGWGSYFSNHNYHCDFSATYGFQVFWDQNMFRTFGGPFMGNTRAPNGNLYIQGLTVDARFDF